MMESITAGEAVSLAAGDAAPSRPMWREIRNEGQERAVDLAFLVVPPEGITGAATQHRSQHEKTDLQVAEPPPAFTPL